MSISPFWMLIITEIDTFTLQPQRAPRLQNCQRNEPTCQGKHLRRSTPETPIVNSRQIYHRLMYKSTRATVHRTFKWQFPSDNIQPWTKEGDQQALTLQVLFKQASMQVFPFLCSHSLSISEFTESTCSSPITRCFLHTSWIIDDQSWSLLLCSCTLN